MGVQSKRWYKMVVERAEGVCEGCKCRHAEQVHHRRFRSRGGGNNPGNLVHLCHGCHGRAHGTGDPAPDGWAISSWDERMEEMVPFTDLYGVAWWLTADGKRKQVTDESA